MHYIATHVVKDALTSTTLLLFFLSYRYINSLQYSMCIAALISICVQIYWVREISFPNHMKLFGNWQQQVSTKHLCMLIVAWMLASCCLELVYMRNLLHWTFVTFLVCFSEMEKFSLHITEGHFAVIHLSVRC